MASSESEGEHYEVDEILGQRKKGRIVEYLVRWRGFGEEEDSWEPARNLKHAKAAIDRYLQAPVTKAPAKTPAKKAPAKAPAKAPTKSAAKQSTTDSQTSTSTRGGRLVTKTTTVTKVVTQSAGTKSESSSPEASPVLSRRTTRQADVKRTVAQTAVTPRKTGPTKPFFTKYDVPIIIFVCMMVFVALTFVFENKLK